jgi:hypothetical protein
VLAPGGVLLFTVWDTVEGSAFPSALVSSVAAALPADPPDFLIRVPHGYTDADRIRADVETGGLQVAAIERVTLRGHAPSAQVLADGFCRGTPLRVAQEGRGSLEALTSEIGAKMTGALGDGSVESDLLAITVTATRPA